MNKNRNQEEDQQAKAYPEKEPVVSKVSDIDFSGIYSYASYLKWDFEERLELIKGRIFKMSASSLNHQRLLDKIYTALHLYLKGKTCEVFAAPFEVRFPYQSKADKNVYTVLQPDICVVCDETRLDKRGCIGAPDVVIEVLRPGNNRTNLKNKFDIYEAHGVREYWIVHPKNRHLLKYVLNADGIFIAGEPYMGGTEFVSDIFPGFRLNIDEVFGAFL